MLKRIYRNLAHRYFKSTTTLYKGWVLNKSKKLNITLLLNLSNYIDFLIYKNGLFEEHVIENIRYFFTKQEISLFVDIGSNIGQMSLFVAKNFPHVKVLSYEAVRSNYIQQHASMLINNLNYDLNNLAISDNNKPLKIYMPKYMANVNLGKFNSGMASIVLDEFRDKDNVIEVPSVVLGPVLEKQILNLNDKFVFFKIDVEGAELMVLNGLISFLKIYGKVIIIIEFLFEKDLATYVAAKDLLLSLGFKMYDKDRNIVRTKETWFGKNDDFIFIKD